MPGSKGSRWMVGIVAGVAVGCAAAVSSPPSSPDRFGAAGSSGTHNLTPLILDRTDLLLGTTVHFKRIPTPTEMRDLIIFPGLAHIVLALPQWPDDYAALRTLDQAPEGPDVIVVLPGYPPSRAAVQAWNYLQARLRIVLVVSGPPSSDVVIADLNEMRHLERVIAQMSDPRRTGFERLQRPLSFRTEMP